MASITPNEIDGRKLSPEQTAYLDGFFNGLRNRGFSFGDVEPNPARSTPSPAVTPQPEPERILEERIKQEQHPLDAYSTLVDHAASNTAPDKEDLFRFKWHGLFYLTPGKEAYMARLRVPGGQLRSYQLREIAAAAQELTSGYIQITTRANLQIRLIEPRNTPEFLHRIQSAGLHTRGAGADNVRNLTCDPTSGLDPAELIETLPLVHQISQIILNNREFFDLPRKFNLALSGGGPISSVEDTNDVGASAIRVIPKSSTPTSIPTHALATDQLAPGIYFKIALGGATGHKAFARDAGVLVTPPDLIKTLIALLRVYIAHGNRTDRKRARVKHLLESWSLDQYIAETEKLLGFKLLRVPSDATPSKPSVSTLAQPNTHAHVGVFPQKQKGLFYIGATVPVGELSSKQLLRLAEIADLYGSGEVRLTVWQSILLPNVPEAFVPTARKALEKLGFSSTPSNLLSGFVTCTGNSYCKFASANTKGHARELMDHLKSRFHLDTPINIHLTGCPNSCAQHYMGDIGLLGTKVKVQGDSVEGYHVFVGGGFGAHQAVGRQLFQGVSVHQLKSTLESMLHGYLNHRQPMESFQAFTARHDLRTLQEFFSSK